MIRPPGDTRPDQEFLDQHRTPRLVGLVWGLLVFNTLGSQGAVTILPVPRPVTQALTMGAVAAAFGIAVLINPRLRIRPNAYLLLLSLLVVVSFASSARFEVGAGAIFRSGRFTLFVATLWLLTPWFDDALTFVRNHIKMLGIVLATVAAGLLVAPGLALPADYDGRLVGAIWPLTAPQVGQYSAVVAGLTALLWIGRRTDRGSALLVILPALVMLLLSHTRTATIGLVAALVMAVLSLTLTSARARKVFGWGAMLAGFVAVALGPVVGAWLRRGQDAESLANLTGRQKVWDALLDAQRSTIEELFGIGLTNKSFNGLPIDSSWLSVYLEQGYVGVVLVGFAILTLLFVAALRPPSVQRACAVFLITYCLIASYTEAGLGDASPYLLNLTLAAALLTRAQRDGKVKPRNENGVLGDPKSTAREVVNP
ncbi:O-antigen ligase family protein [Actinophytocola sp.]|uniref:O-antigen ligase family protein n=1 Tax=Actinophytocola sp. TaxID=1872138 RepID=UPI0039C87B3D